MGRHARTKTELIEEIIKQAMHYTMGRTWWGAQNEAKKRALRTMSRHARALCALQDHKPGWIADGRKPEMFDCCHKEEGLPFKCPVCDPTGENKGYDRDEVKKRRNRPAPAAVKKAHKALATAFGKEAPAHVEEKTPTLGTCPECDAQGKKGTECFFCRKELV